MSTAAKSAHPLVSIVTPVFNGAPYIGLLVESVLRQSYKNIEHIVIDDGSTDGGATVAVLKQYPELRWWARENRGQYATLNEGFRAAKGEIITTISADDVYADDEVIEAVVQRFLDEPRCDVVFGESLHIDEKGMPLPVQPYQGHGLWVMPYFPFILHCSLFVRTARIHEQQLFFDPTYRFLGDADWLVRLYRAGLRHARMRRPIAAYRHHPVQTTKLAALNVTAAEDKKRERKRFEHAYVSHAWLKRAIDAYVTMHRRWRKARFAVLNGGLNGLRREFIAWKKRGA